MSAGLAKLPTLKVRGGRKLPLLFPHRLPVVGDVKVPVIYGSKSSTWETVLGAFFNSQNPYWVPQEQIGAVGGTGDTSADFFNQMLKIAFYLDGPVHTFRNLGGHDLVVRSAWLGLGYRVVAWAPQTLRELRTNMRTWYMRDIEGLSV